MSNKLDVAKFVEWYQKMDYEGGVEAMIRYGGGSSGDAALDGALEEMQAAMDVIDGRLDDLLCTPEVVTAMGEDYD